MINNILIKFYNNEVSCKDGEKHFYKDILNWNNVQLEHEHHYIQWLFPLEEASRFNLEAPLLDKELIDFIKTNKDIQRKIQNAYLNMLKFYGLKIIQINYAPFVLKTDNFSEKPHWLSLGNHNYLRITRMLRCLTLIGLEKEAEALLDYLESLSEEDKSNISERTFDFWKKAVIME